MTKELKELLEQHGVKDVLLMIAEYEKSQIDTKKNTPEWNLTHFSNYQAIEAMVHYRIREL